MNMNLRVSRSFLEGMKYPRRISSNNLEYSNLSRNSTVEKAWKNTGGFLQKSLNEYGKTNSRKIK